MKYSIRVLLLIVFIGMISIGTLSACKKNETSDFAKLNQQELVKAMGLGWNLGNQLEANKDKTPEETNWGNPLITEDLMKAVKVAGFHSIRIPISYFSKIGDAPDYTIDKAWLDRIQEVVDYCIKNDLYVVINIHGDGFQSIDGGWLYADAEDQATVKAKFSAVWKQIATRFKNYDEHLIFESMNEISDMSYAEPKQWIYDNINTYNQVFLDTIRQTGGYNNLRWVLIPGWNTDITYTAGDYGFIIPTDNYLSDKIPEGENRIIISAHYYAPWDFCGGESGEITQWGDDATDPAKTSTHSGQGFMAAQFKLLYDKFTSKGFPVIIGEFGAIDKCNYDEKNSYYREFFDHKICENSIKYGCIPMYWDNGYNSEYGLALFDREKATVTQQGIIDAMLKVYQPVEEAKGTSTGIKLDRTKVDMEIGADPVSLATTLTPVNSSDTINWSSSDETVVTVNSQGVLKAQNMGTAIVTASANGNKAECTVNVVLSDNVSVRLYAIETKAWSSVQSEERAVITPEGGTFTLTIKGSKDILSNIGSLYLKDQLVQGNIIKASQFSGAKIRINSVKFNGVDCTPLVSTEDAINPDSLAFDYCLLNRWVEKSEKISGASLSEETGSYYFTAADYQDSNTIEVTFTVSDIVMAK